MGVRLKLLEDLFHGYFFGLKLSFFGLMLHGEVFELFLILEGNGVQGLAAASVCFFIRKLRVLFISSLIL